MVKVCHVTSVHKSNDVRIFRKECVSLAKEGYDVYLVAQGDNCVEEGVNIVGVGEAPQKRISRMFRFTKKVYQRALSVDADIYHLHDPELLKYGKRLKARGKKVVFDSHEYVRAQILYKHWIPKFLRKPFSSVYAMYERKKMKGFDALIVVADITKDLLKERNACIEVIHNYPIMEQAPGGASMEERDNIVCYAGAISLQRGMETMFRLSNYMNGTVHLAGSIPEERLFNELVAGDNNVVYDGYLNAEALSQFYQQSVCGLSLLLPTPQYYESVPTKIFDYMAAKLPVIASKFPVVEQIVEQHQCGICVDPENIQEITDSINYLFANREEAARMGQNGFTAAVEQYNWQHEALKLCELYQKILNVNLEKRQ